MIVVVLLVLFIMSASSRSGDKEDVSPRLRLPPETDYCWAVPPQRRRCGGKRTAASDNLLGAIGTCMEC